MSPQFEIQLIAVIVAVACSLPGVFLVLRKMSMISDCRSCLYGPCNRMADRNIKPYKAPF